MADKTGDAALQPLLGLAIKPSKGGAGQRAKSLGTAPPNRRLRHHGGCIAFSVFDYMEVLLEQSRRRECKRVRMGWAHTAHDFLIELMGLLVQMVKGIAAKNRSPCVVTDAAQYVVAF